MNHPVSKPPQQFSCAAVSDFATLAGRAATGEEAEAARRFSCLAPVSFLSRLQPGDPADPLLRQILPSGLELQQVDGFVEDPLAEQGAAPLPGVIQRFAGRALLLTTAACAIHCRYCFRRHDPFRGVPVTREEWQPVLAHLAGDSSLREVILSGGDPLTLPDPLLSWLIRQLAAIPHLRRVRVHTRMAVAVPERIQPDFIDALTATRLQAVVMVHVNHAAELDQAAGDALGRLSGAGVLLYNQSVLLAGVNDHVVTLVQLCESLLAAHVTPCYLHLLDPVAGAAHFQVAEEQGIALVQHLRRLLPGYAVPRLVREIPELGIKKIVAA